MPQCRNQPEVACEEGVLPNGLRWIAVPMEGVATATVVVGAKVGAAHEDLSHNYGVAHFLEHLFFKGGKRYPKPKEVALAIDRVGGISNAFTSYLNTHYWVSVPATHLATAFDVLEDMLRNATIPPEELERERKVILEEISRYEDDPESSVWHLMQESLFGHQPLGGTILGTRRSIQGMTRETVVSFRETYYRPDNLVVAVAGAIDQSALPTTLERWFGSWQTEGAPPPDASFDPSLRGIRVAVSTRTDLTQAHLIIGTSLPIGIHDPAAYALEVAAFALGGSLSSRFFHLIREERGLAYRVSTSFDAYQSVSTLTTYVGTAPQNLREVVALLSEEHVKLGTEGITEEECTTAREALAGRYALRSETSHAIANHAAFASLYQLADRTPAAARQRILSTSYDEVQDALRHLARAPLHLAVVSALPEDEVKKAAEPLLSNPTSSH